MIIVSFGMMIPDHGIGNAGGEFYAHHVRSLQSLGHDVRVVAPEGVFQRGPLPTWFRHREIPSAFRFESRAWTVFNRLLVGGLRPRYRNAVLTDPVVREWVSDADVIEYQWVEFGALARGVQRLDPRPRASYIVVHDEVAQREERRAESAAGWRSIVLRAGAALARVRERALFRRTDATLCISEKDAARCRAVLPGLRVRVVPPPVVPTRDAAQLAPGAGSRGTTVLFVGAMARQENEDAASWFITSIWPGVLAEVPEARFVVAGSDPSAAMRAHASGRIEVTGFVPDLEAVYDSAAVVVVPLRRGAGVKFKTIDALAHGVPVVTTDVGREGIFEGADDAFAAVTDDPSEFAAAVVRALLAPASDRERAATANRACAEFGIDGYPARLAPFIEEVRSFTDLRAGTSRRA